jgi:hypothetical protein
VDQAERGFAGKGRRGVELTWRGAHVCAWLGLDFGAETADEWRRVAERATLARLIVSLSALATVALVNSSVTIQLAPIKWAFAVGVVTTLWTLATACFLFASTRGQGNEVFTRVIINMLPVDVVLSYLSMSAATSLADIALFNANAAAQAVLMFLATFVLIFAAAFSYILADRHSVALDTFLA